MLDVKELLEKTNLKVGEVAFSKPPQLPYIILLEAIEEGGADYSNNIVNRDISIEFYSIKINREKENEIEELLKSEGISFTKNRSYIAQDKVFETIYDFSIYEKK